MDAHINTYELATEEYEKKIGILESSLYSLLDPSTFLIVYAMSNFYKNYNVHNKRYYAKVSNKVTNNKAEAIPFLQIKGSNQVIDLYKLKEKIRLEKGEGNFSLFRVIRDSYIKKEDLIEQVGNKVLKNYKG